MPSSGCFSSALGRGALQGGWLPSVQEGSKWTACSGQTNCVGRSFLVAISGCNPSYPHFFKHSWNCVNVIACVSQKDIFWRTYVHQKKVVYWNMYPSNSASGRRDIRGQRVNVLSSNLPIPVILLLKCMDPSDCFVVCWIVVGHCDDDC
jgi:hypothetical protein